MAENSYIPEKIYKILVRHAPRVCVDLMVVDGNKFLLGKRKIVPLKNRWCFVGGRVFKNETRENAAKRKLQEELGVKPVGLSLKCISVEDVFVKADGRIRHDVNTVFMVKINNKKIKYFDKKQHSELAWFDKIDPNWHPYIRKTLKMAGFK